MVMVTDAVEPVTTLPVESSIVAVTIPRLPPATRLVGRPLTAICAGAGRTVTLAAADDVRPVLDAVTE
jgi:hypothetical protein